MVLVARLSYGLPYHWAGMLVRTTSRRVHYESRRGAARASIDVEIGDPLPHPDGLTLFLTERYRLYTRLLGGLAVAAVEHEPWPLHQARLLSFGGNGEASRRAARR